jgi:hypothetical protein
LPGSTVSTTVSSSSKSLSFVGTIVRIAHPELAGILIVPVLAPDGRPVKSLPAVAVPPME